MNITEPVDGETYDGDWLTVRAIVENENEIPEYVQYSLNGQPVVLIPRLNTDWYTYMQNDLHHGYSESPAPTDNTILWTAPVTGTTHEFPTPVIVEGIVYYPSNDGTDSLYALDAATGELIWKYRTGYTDDAVTVKNGYLYTASDSLWCLDALTGERIWATSAADNSGSTPAVVDGNVYALDSTTIDLCLSVFWWAEFRKHKGGIKLHTLYDVKTSIPTFIHISNQTTVFENATSDHRFVFSSSHSS